MERFEKIKMEVLKDSKEDIKLKNYFNRINNIVGEDYASLTLSANESIKKSLSNFTSDLEDIKEENIIFSLLKSAVLSNDKHNSSVAAAKYLIEKGSIEDLITAVNVNLSFRKALTKVFIKQSHRTYERIYELKNDNDNTLGELLSLYLFKKRLEQEKKYKLEKKGI